MYGEGFREETETAAPAFSPPERIRIRLLNFADSRYIHAYESQTPAVTLAGTRVLAYSYPREGNSILGVVAPLFF
jgi:hypothetical protein